ncbi:YueI family protein [Cytobacillus purgationiresistens]|uniref:Uncharacterized protein YueI n=1 Tax=Cytobacillus purgationiresistens TaxID=863449 RepID=A0ABU0ANR7_9BACI|nr:YueI family protein [Cytobacillus purgationiresistens]MDQ0272921.1 uncharacterized protein YueI [Cytobacillus purgationiresistens]
MAEKIDEYLKQGMYGQKQTKPDERRRFLGTLRERTVIALKQPQVRKPGIIAEVESALQDHSKARLYLNGHMSYQDLSKYIKVATSNHVDYTIVTNKDFNSELGLVLAYDYAIDHEEIYVTIEENNQTKPEAKSKTGLFTLIKKVLRRG